MCKIQRKSGVKSAKSGHEYNYFGGTSRFEAHHNNHVKLTSHNVQLAGHHCDHFYFNYLNETSAALWR